jgi:hypothetical protein
MEDELKNASDFSKKFQLISDFKDGLTKDGLTIKLSDKLYDKIENTQKSLLRESMRAWIDSAHQCLNQYIDGKATLGQLKNCLQFHY